MNYQNTLLKTYRKDIWSKYLKAITDYDLIQPNDAIAVCISGGKDSMLLALCFKTLVQFSDVPFTVKYLVMDPGYSPENRQKITDNAKELEIDIEIFDSSIFEIVDNIEKSPCYLCARMRRGYLYEFANSLGCNKIALGHHYDDAIETTLMNLFYGGQVGTMLPRLTSTSHPDMEIIRPLYYVREDNIIRWVNYTGLTFLKCACKFTELSEINPHESNSKRKEIKQFIRDYKKINPFIEANIFRSMERVNLNKVISYYDDDQTVDFLDRFNNKEKTE